MAALRRIWIEKKHEMARARTGALYWCGGQGDIDKITAAEATTKLYVLPDHLDLMRLSIVAQLVILKMFIYLGNLGLVARGGNPTVQFYYDECLLSPDQLALKKTTVDVQPSDKGAYPQPTSQQLNVTFCNKQ